ncbi:hypothetical protein [Burkholderia cenocepacia]|uniref:hypothetical protein n=1 Tax=Burkholderia cenocepacia TaxID=95486 RepID=UPI002AB194BE|nr:hypothetical protein [Burkholderia cenocepacia]
MSEIFETVNSAAARCTHVADVDASGVSVAVKCERPEFIDALREYFFIPCSPHCKEFPFVGAELIYCHGDDLFFKVLDIASRFRVIERIEFHPDNFYEVIYRDEFGEVLESRGGIRHLIIRSSSRRRYCIITPGFQEGVLEFQKPGIRLIREIAFRAHQSVRYFPLHASVAGTGSRGFLFVGDSGAGKTTLAAVVSAMADEGVFVSSDIALIRHDGTGVDAIGWPGGGISVGTGTLDCLRAAVSVPQPEKVFLHEEGYVRKGKRLVTPAEFSEMLGGRVGVRQSIDAIVFPKITPEDESFQIEQLSFERAFELASSQLRDSISDTHRYGLVDFIGEDIESVNAQALVDLDAATRMLPAFSIHGHPVAIARHLINDLILYSER